MLLCEKVKFKTALVVCPLNTALNWLNEFAKWQKGMKRDEILQVSYINVNISNFPIFFIPHSLISVILVIVQRPDSRNA